MLRTILAKMRHDGCGGLAAKAELLTGIEGASARPVRRIVLITDPVSWRSTDATSTQMASDLQPRDPPEKSPWSDAEACEASTGSRTDSRR